MKVAIIGTGAMGRNGCGLKSWRRTCGPGPREDFVAALKDVGVPAKAALEAPSALTICRTTSATDRLDPLASFVARLASHSVIGTTRMLTDPSGAAFVKIGLKVDTV